MKKFKFYLPLVAMAAICMAFVSCSSSDNDEDGGDNASVLREETMTIEPAKVYGPWLFYNSQNYVSNNWPKSGFSFKLYLEQGNGIFYVGTKHTVETSIEEDATKSDVHVKVPITSNIDTQKAYHIIAVDGNCDASLSNGAIVCSANLKRGIKYCYTWYLGDVGTGFISTAQAQYITSCEVLYIRNNTSATITVKHKGFETLEKWYYSKANVNITASASVKTEPVGISVGAEEISDATEIAAGERGFIMSQLVPNGKKMTDASLILEINGKEFKTTPTSSSVTFENGKPYFVTVAWDGNELVWE